MENFQKAAIIFSELKKKVKISNKDDRIYLEILKITLDKMDVKEIQLNEKDEK